LKSNLAESIDLWADVIINPSFAPEEIERTRTIWLSTIEQEKADPTSLALRLLPGALYGEGHAYAVPFTGSGTPESISSITQETLQTFHDTWMRPDNATVFVVGDTTLEEITPLLERAFRRWDAPNTPLPTKNVADVPLRTSPRVVLIDKPGSPQSVILAAHTAPGLGTDRDIGYDAMNYSLGGAFTSRVNMNLREEKGWSYGVRTQLVGARGPRPFLLTAPVQTDRTGDSLAELVRELTEVKATRPITQEEMDRAIAGLTLTLPGQFETSAAVLNSLQNSQRYGRPLDYAGTLTQRYGALTLNDVESATEIVHPEALTWVVVGDLAQIRGQVEALGIAPIEIWNDDGEPIE
jgi:zinc protease